MVTENTAAYVSTPKKWLQAPSLALVSARHGVPFGTKSTPVLVLVIPDYPLKTFRKKTSAIETFLLNVLDQVVTKNGALGRIRTYDRLVRSQVLYPAELRARQGRE